MTTFLLVDREDESLREKTRFPLVNQSFFEMKSAVLKSMISQSRIRDVPNDRGEEHGFRMGSMGSGVELENAMDLGDGFRVLG